MAQIIWSLTTIRWMLHPVVQTSSITREATPRKTLPCLANSRRKMLDWFRSTTLTRCRTWIFHRQTRGLDRRDRRVWMLHIMDLWYQVFNKINRIQFWARASHNSPTQHWPTSTTRRTRTESWHRARRAMAWPWGPTLPWARIRSLCNRMLSASHTSNNRKQSKN